MSFHISQYSVIDHSQYAILCDAIRTLFRQEEPFMEYTKFFQHNSPARRDGSSLRLVYNTNPDLLSQSSQLSSSNWNFILYKRPLSYPSSLIRHFVEFPIESNFDNFYNSIPLLFDQTFHFEHVIKGLKFNFHSSDHNLEIRIFRLYALNDKHNINDLRLVYNSNQWIVSISSQCKDEDQITNYESSLFNITTLLSDYVKFIKVDPLAF